VILISDSPCQGCAGTVKEFKQDLKKSLGTKFGSFTAKVFRAYGVNPGTKSPAGTGKQFRAFKRSADILTGEDIELKPLTYNDLGTEFGVGANGVADAYEGKREMDARSAVSSLTSEIEKLKKNSSKTQKQIARLKKLPGNLKLAEINLQDVLQHKGANYNPANYHPSMVAVMNMNGPLPPAKRVKFS